MDYADFSPIYAALDPQKKDAAWFNQVVTLYRRYWYPVVVPTDSIYRKSLLDGRQSIQKVIDSFDDKGFKDNSKIVPLKIMNSIVNNLIEDIKSNPPKAELTAVDPTAVSEKKEDIQLLKNRKIVERDRTNLQSRIGLPPYKLPYDKFSGNVDKFDDLGLDEQDEDDTTFYEENLQKMNYEIAMQNLVNSITVLSRTNEGMITNYVREALANNVICGQVYVDEISGEIRREFLYPEEFWGIFSDTEDGYNDICKGWQRQITVGEFLRRAGNDFDFSRDWPQLLFAINYCMGTKYTGFVRNGQTYCCTGNPALYEQGYASGVLPGYEVGSNPCQWNIAYRYKVYCGYIEWPSIDATETYIKRKDGGGDYQFVPYSYQLDEKIRTAYQKESWYQEQMYKAFFIATTTATQWVFNYGKVYHQILEGANDQYARWTLWSYRNPGSTAVEVAEPFIDFANFAFYRMKFLLYKAKPEDEQYLIEELLSLSKGFQQLNTQSNSSHPNPIGQTVIDQLIQYQRQKTIKIRALPEINGKKENILVPLHNENRGADPMLVVMQSIVVWAQQMIQQQLGINPMRIGGNPQPRESFKSESVTLEQSYATTNYIYRMIQYMNNHMATVCTLYAQDIIRFKDSAPYKWITNMIGTENAENISVFEKAAAHRFAVFVQDINTAVKKDQILQAANLALAQKQITMGQWAMVTQAWDYKRAIDLLTHYEKKKIKQDRAFEIRKIREADAAAQNEHNRKMQQMEFDRTTRWGQADREAQAYIASAQINKEGKINVQEIKEAAKIPQQEAKTKAKIEEETAKRNLEQQQPLADGS